MRYNGEILGLFTGEDAKQFLTNTKHTQLPERRKHLTLMVEGDYAIIMENIGYDQYQVKSCYIDKRSK